MDTVRLGPFLGMDNRLPDAKLATADGAFLRNAVNVDITDAGTLQRRAGAVQHLAGADCHSLWSDGTHMYHVDYASLRCDGAIIHEGLALGMPMSYCTTPRGAVCSNGRGIWWLSPSGLTAFTAGATASARHDPLALSAMPAGQIVRHHNGRLLVAKNNLLYYSEPFALHLNDPARGYIPFPAEITLVEPCGQGFFVAADQTYFVAGDIAQADVSTPLPHGAIPYTSLASATGTEVWWMSERGLVRGTPGGQTTYAQAQHVVTGGAAAGATLQREQDGVRQLITSMFNTQQSRAAASTYMDAEIVRQGDMQ